MPATRLILGGILLGGLAAAQYPGLQGMPSSQQTAIKRIDCEIVKVNVESMEITLRDKKDGKEYITQVDKSTRLRADKKVLDRKPEFADFKVHDEVKVVLLPKESRLAEIKLVKRGQSPPGS